MLCRKVESPNKRDWNAVKRLTRYLQGTIHLKLKLQASDNPRLVGYADADRAGDTTDRKSTSGHLFFYGGGAVSGSSRKQERIAVSKTEAEYVSAAEACKQLNWILQMQDFGIEEPKEERLPAHAQHNYLKQSDL